MILLSAQNLSKTYLERTVLNDVSFFLNEGDRVGIVGINGTGKSTLLRILAGVEEPDSGTVIRTKGIRISYLPQIPDFAEHGSILEQVMAHLPADLKSAKEFEAKSILQQLGISNVDSDISTLSGGERRRTGIAAAWIQPSDVLLLDEPTNHIDYETVQFLEDQLKKYRGAIVMVTHDRYFLNRITNQIVEVDRGKLFVSRGNYSEYLEQKAQREADAEARERKNRTLYRQELEWMPQVRHTYGGEAFGQEGQSPKTAWNASMPWKIGKSPWKQNPYSCNRFLPDWERKPSNWNTSQNPYKGMYSCRTSPISCPVRLESVSLGEMVLENPRC